MLALTCASQALASEALFQAIDEHRERAALELMPGGKASLEARNAKGDTPLHRAVETGLRQLARALLDAGAEPGARNADGDSPLHWAALSGHIVVVQRLLARGADPRARNRKGLTPGDYARRDGHDEVVRLLERFGK